ncbi:MAG: hypothetical protein F4237_11390 [Gemmatimonadetes bacterium]|nr:hypothetical protein [Gemmatimonadota bacterium]
MADAQEEAQAEEVAPAPKRVKPKKADSVLVPLNFCYVRGDVPGLVEAAPNTGLRIPWPRVRDVAPASGHNVVKAVMPADVLESCNLYGAVVDTGEEAGELWLHNASKLGAEVVGKNIDLWNEQRYEGAEAISCTVDDWAKIVRG